MLSISAQRHLARIIPLVLAELDHEIEAGRARIAKLQYDLAVQQMIVDREQQKAFTGFDGIDSK
jgi:hypothetical protein